MVLSDSPFSKLGSFHYCLGPAIVDSPTARGRTPASTRFSSIGIGYDWPRGPGVVGADLLFRPGWRRKNGFLWPGN